MRKNMENHRVWRNLWQGLLLCQIVPTRGLLRLGLTWNQERRSHSDRASQISWALGQSLRQLDAERTALQLLQEHLQRTRIKKHLFPLFLAHVRQSSLYFGWTALQSDWTRRRLPRPGKELASGSSVIIKNHENQWGLWIFRNIF